MAARTGTPGRHIRSAGCEMTAVDLGSFRRIASVAARAVPLGLAVARPSRGGARAADGGRAVTMNVSTRSLRSRPLRPVRLTDLPLSVRLRAAREVGREVAGNMDMVADVFAAAILPSDRIYWIIA